jgi:rhamnose utilization protein RhaD (predicted bifunctional aldolase and dehydrogenase)
MGVKELVEISREYGVDPDYVLAGGGNTSFKDATTLWVKASGVPLATIDEDGFVALSRERLAIVATHAYSPEPAQREEEVKRHLLAARVDPASTLRPSVEASLHDLIAHPYVVHTHPHLVNAMLCGRDGAAAVRRLFGGEAIYVPYTDPGYTLYLRVKDELGARAGSPPALIFLENHGVFVGGATPAAVRDTYRRLMQALRAEARPVPAAARTAPRAGVAEVLPAIRMLLSGDTLKVGAFLSSPLADHFTGSAAAFADVASAFTPDQIVYCKAHALHVDAEGSPAEVIAAFQAELARFTAAHGYPPRIVALRGLGVAAFEDSAASAEIALAVFEDTMKIAADAGSFGGPRFLTREAIAFIDGWEVENYRRSVSKGSRGGSHLAQRIAVVTGGAQGFGAGIVEHLHADGLNVVVADLNEERGRALVAGLQARPTKNRARVG